MFYNFIIQKEITGFIAECIELKGCVSQGDTMEELQKNLKEALNLYLDEPSTSNQVFPFPKNIIKEKNVIQIQVEPKIAFATLLRSIRLKNKITQKEAAERLGFKNIWSYQILESSKKNNPSLETISKIKKAFPEFDVNSIF
jgi:antitoxin HicB